jgi:hypothetical protein
VLHKCESKLSQCYSKEKYENAARGTPNKKRAAATVTDEKELFRGFVMWNSLSDEAKSGNSI